MITAALATLVIAPAATISGTVTIGGKPVKDAAVWVGSPATVRAARPTTAKVTQRGKRFLPHVLIVPVGSTVDFPNQDNLYHNVFSSSKTKRFDLGMYPKGQSKGVKMTVPGIVPVLCNVHAEMSAFVVVVGTNHYALTDSKGRYSISNVPNGDYVIKAWHESGKTAQQPLKASGGTAKNLSLSR